jgi:antitoxin Phd
MARIWQLQQAKSKLSQVVEEAIGNGPQVITRRGVEVVMVLFYAEYRKMISLQKPLSMLLSGIAPGGQLSFGHT